MKRTLVILLLLAFTAGATAAPASPTAAKAIDVSHVQRLLEAELGTTAADAAKKYGVEGRRFQAAIDAYGTAWTAAPGNERSSLAEALAAEIFDSACWDYNMKLSIVGANLRVPCRVPALSPVARELVRRWDATRWERRLVIGGAIVVGVAVTGFVVVAGGWALLWTGYEATLLVPVGATLALDAAVAVLGWYVWKANPGVVLLPALNDGVRTRLTLGELVTCEAAPTKGRSAATAAAVDCPCFGNLEGR